MRKETCRICGNKFIVWQCDICGLFPLTCIDCHDCSTSHNYAIGKHGNGRIRQDIQYHGSKHDEW